jgi:hypothetical protein
VKRDRPPEFRRKGNEKQYKFNEEVLEKLDTMKMELTASHETAVTSASLDD